MKQVVALLLQFLENCGPFVVYGRKSCYRNYSHQRVAALTLSVYPLIYEKNNFPRLSNIPFHKDSFVYTRDKFISDEKEIFYLSFGFWKIKWNQMKSNSDEWIRRDRSTFANQRLLYGPLQRRIPRVIVHDASSRCRLHIIRTLSGDAYAVSIVCLEQRSIWFAKRANKALTDLGDGLDFLNRLTINAIVAIKKHRQEDKMIKNFNSSESSEQQKFLSN